MLLGGLFVAGYEKIGLSLTLFFFLIAITLLLALVLYDLTHQMLPYELLVPFVLISAVSGFSQATASAVVFHTLLVAVVLAGGLALIHVLSRGRMMGLADAPLTLGLALLVGGAAFSGFIFSFWIGALVGVGILLSRPAGSRIGVEVPFAPFLAAGFLLAYFTQWNPFMLIAALL